MSSKINASDLPDLSMPSFMIKKIAFSCEPSIAELTLIWSLTRVCPDVILQRNLLR